MTKCKYTTQGKEKRNYLNLLTYKRIVCCSRETTFLVEQSQKSQWLSQEHVLEINYVLCKHIKHVKWVRKVWKFTSTGRLSVYSTTSTLIPSAIYSYLTAKREFQIR